MNTDAEPCPQPARLAAAPDLAGATRLGALALLRGAAGGDALRAGPHLAIREPGRAERIVPIAGELTVGRAASAAVRLSDPAASRLHLRLRAAPDGLAAEDLGSRNGLVLNGKAAPRELRLRHGDELTLGKTVIRFADPFEPGGDAELAARASPAPAPAPARGPGDTGRWWLPGAALLLVAAALVLALPWAER